MGGRWPPRQHVSNCAGYQRRVSGPPVWLVTAAEQRQKGHTRTALSHHSTDNDRRTASLRGAQDSGDGHRLLCLRALRRGSPFRERFVRRAGWRVAHDFNSSLDGWLILAPLRHVYALVELTREEATALGALLRESSIELQRVTGCSKTYVMLFAEAEGFAQLHVHVVPRTPYQPAGRRGPDVFGYLEDGRPIPPERRDAIAEALLAAWPH